MAWLYNTPYTVWCAVSLYSLVSRLAVYCGKWRQTGPGARAVSVGVWDGMNVWVSVT